MSRTLRHNNHTHMVEMPFCYPRTLNQIVFLIIESIWWVMKSKMTWDRARKRSFKGSFVRFNTAKCGLTLRNVGTEYDASELGWNKHELLCLRFPKASLLFFFTLAIVVVTNLFRLTFRSVRVSAEGWNRMTVDLILPPLSCSLSLSLSLDLSLSPHHAALSWTRQQPVWANRHAMCKIT